MVQPYTRSRWWAIPVFVIFVAFSLGTYAAFRELILAYNSSSWPSVQGEIIEIFPTASYGDVFAPAVRYRYRIGQETFENHLIVFGSPVRVIRRKLNHDALNHDALKALWLNKTIEVSYSPQDPQTSVLFPGVYWEVPLGCVVVSTSVVVIGLLLVHMCRAPATTPTDATESHF